MKLSVRIIQLTLLSQLVAGCTFMGSVLEEDRERSGYGKTLADLQEVDIPDEIDPVPVTRLEVIEDSYRAALSVAKDPGVRHRILTRLADLEMAKSERNQLTTVEQQEYYTGAIDMYQELLVLNSDRQGEEGTPTNERLLYQLSKAYALDGRIEESDEILDNLVKQFPDSPFAAEADFRRAEKAFSQGRYAEAEMLYARVVETGKGTPFYLNAVYMHGWSQFKQSKYRESLTSFTEVLDKTIIKDRPASEMSNTERNMSRDTLRVISIAFSYLDGADTITAYYNHVGHRHYAHLLYLSLGDLYLEKQSYRASADTYRHYVREFPNTDEAPSFSVKAIEVYKTGGFPSLILPAKEEYVRNYGIYSQFWSDRDNAKRAQVIPNLALYLEELSTFYHSRGIDLKKLNSDYDTAVARGRKPKNKPEPAQADFLKAAAFYEEFVATFPKNPKAAEMAYLMGEAYYEAGKLPQAVTAYELVAYNYIDDKRGAEAGYSAVVVLQELMDRYANQPESETEYLRWRDHKIESGISYADYYPMDPRAVKVLAKATQEVFEKNDFDRASRIAKRITEWQPAPDVETRKTAWLIMAHSDFDLQRYAQAEVAYRTTLGFLPANDPDRPKIVERIAASIYKQSEAQIAAGDIGPAVDRLLSLREAAPGTEIAISGQYDAANYLIEMKDWKRAEQVLVDFKQRYPNHQLSGTLAPKFALVYQESQQWGKAAAALQEMARLAKTPEEKRQAQYLSAELYEKSGNVDQAIGAYRDYVRSNPQPFDIATEARFHLVELYGKKDDVGSRNFWLKQLMEEDAKAGSSRTDRSKYLAAFAATDFANQEFTRYERIKLTLPLKKSLKSKKSALDVTLNAYKKSMSYGVAEFTTQANHRIGRIYSQLSKDLMNSQRPNGLDDLALEQYEILLEEQAYPFEEKAIEILASNAERAWSGIYDDWVKQSFKTLAEILPARYGKKETEVEFSDAIF